MFLCWLYLCGVFINNMYYFRSNLSKDSIAYNSFLLWCASFINCCN